MRTNKIRNIRDLESALVDLKAPVSIGWGERFIFGSISRKAEIVIRQFILQRYAGPPLHKALFCRLGSGERALTYPMPSFWQKVMIDNNVSVNGHVSSWSWGLFIVLRYLHGLSLIISLVLKGLWSGFSPASRDIEVHAYFDGLHERNLPRSALGQSGFEICSWYSRWSDRASEIKVLGHNVAGRSNVNVNNLTVKYLPEPHAYLTSIRETFRFLNWAVPSLVLAFGSILCGRWWNALILAEAARAKVVSLKKKNTLASDYLFHFSRSIYRPMWTYAAENKGSRILCYFYSTFAEPSMKREIAGQKHEWGPSTWPSFLVWDHYQAEVLRRDLGDSTSVLVVGPIAFSDSAAELPRVPTNSIAVFDIQPQRKSRTFGISTVYDYYYTDPSVHYRFLKDVEATLRACRFTALIKAKRDIFADGDAPYDTLLREMSNRDNVLIIPSEISAPRLMRECLGSISAPFTSTALYFQEKGYSSVYYDPSCILDKADPAAHGVRVLSGKKELMDWVIGLST